MTPAGIGFKVDDRQLQAYARKVQRLHARRLRNEAAKAARAATKDTRRKIRAAIQDALPAEGGLNRWAAMTPGVRVETAGPRSGVSLTLRKTGHDIKALNRGVARHPVWGNTEVWRNTYFRDRARWFEAAVEKDRARIMRELEKSISTAVKDVIRKG